VAVGRKLNAIRQALGNRRSNTERLMYAPEVVVHVEQRYRVLVILKALAEGIGKPCEPANIHSHGQVLPFYEAGRDMARIGVTYNDLPFGAHTLRGAVPLLAFRSVVVVFHELRKVYSILKRSVRDGPQNPSGKR
jgi:hypothetical protein